VGDLSLLPLIALEQPALVGQRDNKGSFSCVTRANGRCKAKRWRVAGEI